MADARARGRLRASRALWFALPTAILVFVSASTPWIAQRVPRFLFPALAAAGAALVMFLFVNSLVQFVRRYRGEGRLRFFLVAVNGVAVVFLVILPLTHRLRAMTPSGDGSPRILAGFGDWWGPEGYARPSPHRGVDIAGSIGADVLASADGRATVAEDSRDLCGLKVVLVHEPHGPCRIARSDGQARPEDESARSARRGSARGQATSTCTWSFGGGPGISRTRHRGSSGASMGRSCTRRIA